MRCGVCGLLFDTDLGVAACERSHRRHERDIIAEAGAIATLCTFFEWVRVEALLYACVAIGEHFGREAYDEGFEVGRKVGYDTAVAELTPTLIRASS